MVDQSNPLDNSNLASLLTTLDLLGNDKDAGGAFSSPKLNTAAIESTATMLTKWWTAALAALGGTTTIAAAATRFWAGLSGGSRTAVIAGTCGLLVAIAVALGWIISSDLRARAVAQSAVYQARAAVAAAYLQGASPGKSTGAALNGAAFADEVAKAASDAVMQKMNSG
jgi:hypothetical protein